MKDIRPALRTYLLSDPTVSGMVGGARIYHVRLDQDVVEPSVVFVKVSETGDYHLAGDSGLGLLRMQIDAWAQKSDQATELANAVYDRLTGARTRVELGGADYVDLRGVFLANGRDDYDDVVQLFRTSRDFIIWYDARQ
jgi:hypothetical protein